MRKFYIFMLAMLCVASTAMAGRSVTDIKTTKTVQLRDAKTIAKKEAKTGLVKNAKLASMKAKLSNLEKLDGIKITAMRKADANQTIEGTWTFQLGDYYFQTSVNGSITYDFEATLDGNEIVFEDPTGYELPFFAEYDEAAGTLTFNREYLGSTTSGYHVYQEPFVYNWNTNDLDVQSIVGTYHATAGTITFESENGISWPAYNDQAGTTMAGYFGIYDLESATKATAGGDDDETWEDMGEATLEDPWVMPAMEVDHHSDEFKWTVPLQRNVENPNIYRLVDPYHVGPMAEENSSTKVGYITFDATDPDHVVFLPTESGFAIAEAGLTKFYCTNTLGYFVAEYAGYGFTASDIVEIYGDEIPYTTFKDGVITLGYIVDGDEIVYDANFGIQGDINGGYAWQDEAGNPADMTGSITFPEPEVETVGTYTMTIQPTTIAGEKTQPTVDIEIEVKKQGDNYWIAELGSTNYFNDQVIPFAYNDATKLATFTASYAGTFDEQHTWFSAFLNNGSGIELNENYPVTFNTTTGFEWTGNSGFGWFITETAEEFAPMDVYSAFYVAAAGNEGNYADASIEGEWDFTLNGHYLGVYSLGEFTDKFTATLEGNTVTFISSTSQYNIVAEFTAENTLTFTKGAVNTPATYTLWQSPYVNTAGVEDLEELTEEVFTATYDAEAGTITFPANSGLLYGYFSEDGTLSYWDDAFDFVTASKSKGEATGIEGAKTEKAEVVYYDLNGRRIDSPKAGIYVKKVGNSVQKVVVK